MTGLEPAAMKLLATLLRSRPATRDELRLIRTVPPGADRLLDQLIRADFVAEADGRLTYHAPDRAVQEQARTLAGLVGLLPELSREWRQGTERSATLDVELVHGHGERWRARAPARAPLNLYPALEAVDELIDAGGSRARVVLPASVLVTDADRCLVDRLVEAGLRVRLVRCVETWLYSDADVLCALPVVWGEHPPTSIMIVHEPSIRALTAAYAERVWRSAEPYRQPRPEWQDVLRLLALGMSDRAIASAHGTSQRTVERRIAEAMAHYGVGTRFELGAAWSVEQPAER